MQINPMIVKTAVSVSLAVVAGIHCVRVHRQEAEKRREINEQAARRIEDIFAAGEIMRQRIGLGHYDGKSLADIYNDLEFYTITNREK